MTKLPPLTRWKTPIFGILATTLLLTGGGCKPASPASTNQAAPPDAGSTPRQPTTADFQAFVQSTLPAILKVSEVKMDPPTRMPNTSPTQTVWLLTTKLTLTPAEDLYSLPTAQDTQPIDQLVAELNALVAWRDVYVGSPYAKACGAFAVKVPAGPLPQLLVVTSPKDHSLPPMYGKMTAEWQVDHWQFEPAQENSVDVLLHAGKPRAEFNGPMMIKGSPEANKTIGGMRDDIAQAKKEIDVIRGHYAKQIADGTKPGTVYVGKVSYRQNISPCELRFLDPPPGGDARLAAFEITLPTQNPVCSYTYKTRVTTELPIPVPNSQAAPEDTAQQFSFQTPNQVPERNVFQTLVRANVKAPRDSLPSYLSSNDHGGQSLLLLDGRIEGTISDFGALPGIQISVQQKP